jgi:16S rRNA (cytosine1402-N4)-methyltransferase
MHTPVLLKEVLAAIEPHANDVILDATFGGGGYSKAFLEQGASVITFDRDQQTKTVAEKLAREFPGKFQFINAPFGGRVEELEKCGIKQVKAIVFDLGVSSMQLDEAERGFSFRHDGPLDMRMGGDGKTAADLVNTLSEKELADILYQFGEEKKSRAIAKAIVKYREEKPFSRTLELAELIEKTIGRHPRAKIHPATRTFQALRIAVNDELGELERGLKAAQQLLKPGAKLALVTFHSLEDRIVKQFLAKEQGASRHAPSKKLTETKWRAHKPVTPAESEIAKNPRARSAKLRFAVKI